MTIMGKSDEELIEVLKCEDITTVPSSSSSNDKEEEKNGELEHCSVEHQSPDAIQNPDSICSSSTNNDSKFQKSQYAAIKKKACIYAGIFLSMVLVSLIVVIILFWTLSFETDSTESSSNASTYVPIQPPSNVEGKIMFIMGGKENSDAIELITKSAGNCMFTADYPKNIPFKRVGFTAVTYSKEVILCGGRGWYDPLESNECWKYKGGYENNYWTRIRGFMPKRTCYGSSTVVGNRLYVFGGYSHKNEIADTLILDLKSEVWDFGPKMPQKVWGHCSITLHETAIVIGGWSALDKSFLLNSIIGLRSTNSWANLGRLKTSRATHGCVVTVYRGVPSVIVAGGMNSYQEALSSVEVLSWGKRELTDFKVSYISPMNQGRMRYPAIGIVENKWLFVAGGEGPLGNESVSVEYYDRRDRTWKMSGKNALMHKRSNGASVMVPSKWFENCFF